jgi:membrane-associated phospholipid phosphatase
VTANVFHVTDEPERANGWRAKRTLAREVTLIATAALLYTLVRGLTSDRIAVAFDNAEQVIAFERALGIFVEPELQGAILGNDVLVRAVNLLYIGYWPMIMVTLGWLLIRRPAQYPRFRNAILASGALSLVIFALYPLAPPRFLPQYGFVDTVKQSASTYRTLTNPSLVNDYAAMPSLHFGWVLLLGIALVTLAHHRVARIAGVILPVLMFASIVLTGNHYIVDGLVGGVVILFGLGVAVLLERRTGSRDRFASRAQVASDPEPSDAVDQAVSSRS